MNKAILSLSERINQKWSAPWAALRALVGAALFCHGAYLVSQPWAVGNWLEVRTTEPLRAGVSLLLMAAGVFLAAGALTRVAAIVAAPFYYWSAVHDLISSGAEPALQTAANVVAVLALLAIAILGPGRYTAQEWWANRNAKPQGATKAPAH